MVKALNENDLDRWAEVDDQFHRSLLDLHGNHRLMGFAASLCDQAHRARTATLHIRAKPRKSAAEHRNMIDAIKSGDAEKASRVIKEHRERAAIELLAILEKLPQL